MAEFEIEGSYKNTKANSNDSFWYGGGNEAYASMAAALVIIPAAKRKGLTIGAYVDGLVKEFWWPTSLVSNGDLIAKFPDRATSADIKAGTDLVKTPTAKSLAETYDNNVETVVTGSGVMINQLTPTSTIRFTNQSSQVIISGMQGIRDGKTVVLLNDTALNLSLLHDNAGAAAGNRLFIQGLNNVNIGVGGAVVFRYSSSKAMWVMIDLWGTDYFPTLIGETTRAMQVTPGGYAQPTELIEFKEWNDARSIPFSKAELNTAYPFFKRGQQVVCQNITGGGITYEKSDDNTNDWLTITTPKTA